MAERDYNSCKHLKMKSMKGTNQYRAFLKSWVENWSHSSVRLSLQFYKLLRQQSENVEDWMGHLELRQMNMNIRKKIEDKRTIYYWHKWWQKLYQSWRKKWNHQWPGISWGQTGGNRESTKIVDASHKDNKEFDAMKKAWTVEQYIQQSKINQKRNSYKL